jgi:mycothiol synthase
VTSPSGSAVARTATLGPDDAEQVRSLVAEASVADGVGPLSEDARLRFRDPADGVTHLVVRGPDDRTVAGYAQLHLGTEADASGELVVSPAHRRAGLGRTLLTALLEDAGPAALQVWAHGDLSDARHLAEAFGFARVRELWQMRRPLDQPLPEPVVPDEVTLRPFTPGRDEAAWLAANADAFATHPEQGGWTGHDLHLREDEPWFDPEGFFLAERAGRLVGFHWTKVADGLGEVYVLGVVPAEAGRGLGGLLTLVGLRHLRSRGLETVLLYVEADNAAAIRVYERLGFTRFAVDVSYRSQASGSRSIP